MSDFVRIVEVGPRDGLQNEKQAVATTDKIALIDQLMRANWCKRVLFLADRVVVLASRPGLVKSVHAVDLPRPRSPDLLTDPAFMAIKRKVLWPTSMPAFTDVAGKLSRYSPNPISRNGNHGALGLR